MIGPGLRIVWTTSALEETTERLFPASRNRSARIRKKLVKRFGGEFRKVPCMWRAGWIVYAHPSLKPRLEAEIAKANAGRSAPPPAPLRPLGLVDLVVP